jgi:hypothetical protein
VEEIGLESLTKEESDQMLSDTSITFAIYKRDENIL